MSERLDIRSCRTCGDDVAVRPDGSAATVCDCGLPTLVSDDAANQ